MSYTLRLLTEEARDLVVEALRAESDKRTRVARGAAQHVAADKAAGVKDVRSGAVRVAMLLAEAGTLADLADELAATEDVPVVGRGIVALTDLKAGQSVAVDGAGHVTAADAVLAAVEAGKVDLTPLEDLIEQEGDDGLSPAAHAAMAQADAFAEEYLEDPDGTDVDTHAIGEDEPADDEVEEVLPS